MKHKKGFYEKYVKRLQDFLCALLALIALSPVMLILVILVRIKLGSPVLFTQDRPGLNGKVFKLYKFRTMTDETDENGELLSDEVRLTSFGKKLRSTSLDELPELINIIKGDMSIVGPRPRDIWDGMYFDDSVRSLDVRPGLTGRSQAYGRNDNSWEQIFEHDKIYASKVTLWQDIKILFKTVGVFLKRSSIEKEQFKWLPEKLLAEKKISQDDFEKSYILSRKIEKEFFETRKGYLVRYKEGEVQENKAERYYSKKAG